MQNENSLELEQLLTGKSVQRRRLIPFWIKIFIWIFIVVACFTPLVFVTSLIGYHPFWALYGLETSNAYSIVGLVICSLFLFKGIIAFSLWTEKNWAIKLGIIDAVIGIMMCSALMIAPIFNDAIGFTFRLELLALIPYLVWLVKVKETWEELDSLT